MLDDRDGWLRRILVGHVPALPAHLGVVQRLHVAGVAQHGGADADADPSLVHHVEHASQAAMRRADQMCLTGIVLAEIQETVRGRPIAHLVVEAGHRDIIGLTERAIRVHADLRHDEERDARHAGRRIREFGEHQVNDVLRDVLITARDPHFVAAEPIGPVALRYRAAPDVTERRADIGLGETHRTEVAALIEGRHIKSFLLCGAVRIEQIRGRLGQH